MTQSEPARGAVVWLSIDPTKGREKRGHRPHLVLSTQQLARLTGLIIVVPMTSVYRPWATRIRLADHSYAIGEQPRTVSVTRITQIDSHGYDVSGVVDVIKTLIEA